MSTCPRCNLPLAATEFPDVAGCGRCGGRWLGPEQLKDLIESAAPLTVGQPIRETAPAADEELLTGLPCPRCALGMRPFNYAGDSGILLDKCPRCGDLWLDAGKLEHVIATARAARQGLEQDTKRFSGDLREVEVHEDALELRDNRIDTTPALHDLTRKNVDSGAHS